MTTPRKPRTYATDRRKLKALDVKMPLGPEHETQRALWTLRLLLKAG
jgi:hypothetical protein